MLAAVKSEAVEAIRLLDAAHTFGLVHDTFHHHLAGEAALFPEWTCLAHISGVVDHAIPVGALRDSHRVLVDAGDRLDNLGQIAALRAGGYGGPLSFEPFASSVHELADPARVLSESMEFLRDRLARRAG